jgi:hypothetical protein
VDREAALKEVYSADLGDFIATRNDLAARLKGSDPELAAEIKALRKPSLIVWAVNRTAHENPKLIEELIDAGAALRDSLADGGSADAQVHTRQRRSLLRSLSDAAVGVLTRAGSNAGPGNLDRISTTFLVASAEEEAAPLLRAGILTEELRSSELSGLGPFADLIDVAAEPVDDRARIRTREEAMSAVRELERRAAQLELEADDAEALARKARRAATEARDEAERAAADIPTD